MTTWYKNFSSQPHQAFFSNGMIFFILFLSLILGVYTQKISIDSSILDYHAYSMIHIVFIQFFIGFLYVVFPRFLVQAQIKVSTYMKHFYLYFFSSVGFFISLLFANEYLFLFSFTLLLAQILSFKTLYEIYKNSKVTNKYDAKWILICFFAGLISHILFYISFFDVSFSFTLKKLAINSGFYIFLFGIIFAVSQRMIPFFTQVKVPEYKINKSSKIMEIFFFLMLLKVIAMFFENAYFSLISDTLFFVFFVNELIKWKLPIFKVSAIMWVLYLSLFWIPLGFFISILENSFSILNIDFIFEKASLHAFALGYFTTILLGFGTRVVLGHSGRTPYANSFTKFLFLALQGVIILRVFASFTLNSNLNYVFWINISSFFLLLILILWSSSYLKILLKGK
ncbi:NnrS family protein [Malaciobacter marinus]|uniref:NnrS family protein n=1 Tax=Malaciobacter marinus TaxID=505249 RepID=UPI003B003FF9